MTRSLSNSTAGPDNNSSPSPVVLINIFTPKPGRLEEFVALQAAELHRLTEKEPPKGWRGSRLHRSTAGGKAVMVTVFDTIEDHQRWLQTGTFAEHVKAIEHLLEDAEPGYYEIAAHAGNI